MHPALIFDQIAKTYHSGRKKYPALIELSLSVSQGEVFGLIGPNGAGKSTAIKLLLNFIRPDSGSITLKGQKVGVNEFRHLLGYLPEKPCLYSHLTAEETISLAGKLSGMCAQELAQHIPPLLETMNLAQAAKQRVGTFSKGMQQRIGFATALIHDPEILVLDEPMSGLDPLGRHDMRQLITQLRDRGKTIFFCSHILSDIEDLCDHIGVIHKGHLLFAGPLNDFTKGQALEMCFVNTIRTWEDAANH